MSKHESPEGSPPAAWRLLPEPFFLRDAETTARELLGKLIVREREGFPLLAARIVETEAYTADDPASHSFRGPTQRNAAMFRTGGIAYVYRIYGIHHCFNVVTGPEGDGSAVLIRAAEPIAGIPAMWEARFPARPFDPAGLCRIANGPGRLCIAMGIRRERHDGVSLRNGELTIRDDGSPVPEAIRDGRIGISRAADLLRRFSIPDSPYVSRRVRETRKPG